jgi:hypothetical protein
LPATNVDDYNVVFYADAVADDDDIADVNDDAGAHL